MSDTSQSKPHIKRNRDTQEWELHCNHDVVTSHTDLRYIEGYLDCLLGCNRELTELAMKWAKSGFADRQEMVLVKYLQSLT